MHPNQTQAYLCHGKIKIFAMKKIRLSVVVLLAALGLVSMGGAMASEGPEVSTVKVVKSEKKKFRLYIPATLPLGSSSVQVALIDVDGTVLYQGAVADRKQEGIPFNLNSLPDGRYYLTVSNDSWWTSQEFSIQANTLVVDDHRVSQFVKPTVSAYAKNKVQLSVQAVNLPDMTVSIYDRNDELVYSDQFKGNVHRLDLNNLPKGSYTVAVGLPYKRFTETIEISK